MDLYNYVVENYYKMSKDELRTICVEAIYQMHELMSNELLEDAIKEIKEIYLDNHGEVAGNPEKMDLYDFVSENYYKMSNEQLKTIAAEALFQLYHALNKSDLKYALKSIEDVYNDTYGDEDSFDEDYVDGELEESTITERAWKYKEPRGTELREYIDAEDYENVLKTIYNIADYYANLLGEDDYANAFEELASLVKDEWEIIDDYEMIEEFGFDSAEELVDERLEMLYDACDDNDIFLSL